jgi:hypothetical protein
LLYRTKFFDYLTPKLIYFGLTAGKPVHRIYAPIHRIAMEVAAQDAENQSVRKIFQQRLNQ